MSNLTAMSLLQMVRDSAKEVGIELGELTVSGPVLEKQHISAASMHLFQGRSSRLNSQLAIKVLDLRSKRQDQQFDAEVRVLKTLNKNREAGSVKLTPTFYMSNKRRGFIVMDWVSGVSLKQRLIIDTMLPSLQRANCFKAGQWIANFHANMGIERRPTNASERFRDLKDQISVISVSARRQIETDKVFKNYLEMLSNQVEQFAGLKVLWSLQHGDCTASNLIVSRNDQSIIGLDFGQSQKRGPVMLDVALFIYRTDKLLYQDYLGHRSHYKKSLELIDEVMTGYEDVAGKQNRQWLTWCLLLRELERWVNLCYKRAKIASSNLFARLMIDQKIRRSRLFCRVILRIMNDE